MTYRLLTELNLAALDTLTRQAFPNTIRADRTVGCSVSDLQMSRSSHTATQVNIRAQATVACGSGTQHTPVIEFDGIDLGGAEVIAVTDGDQLELTPATVGDTTVSVRCTCTDYRFRFAEYNAQAGTHVPPAVDSYVPSGTRPPANPARTPGMCKHLYALTEILVHAKLLSR